MMEQAHVWVWRDNLGERQPTEPTQPPASESLRRPDFTPEAIGTWAAKQKASTVLCQAYQHNQCADNPCSMGAPTLVLRASDHICCLKYPACMCSWYIKQAKQDCWRAEQLAWLAAGSATTAVIQQLGRSNGLQQQGHCSSQAFQARMMAPRRIHLPDNHQPPMWHHSRAPQMSQRLRRYNAQRCWITRAAVRC